MMRWLQGFAKGGARGVHQTWYAGTVLVQHDSLCDVQVRGDGGKGIQKGAAKVRIKHDMVGLPQ
eukprot:1145356-Pelagomonas_calceolata.AAC.2